MLVTVPKKIFYKINSCLQGIVFFLLLLNTEISAAQDRCGTVPYIKKLQQQGILNESEREFEKWIHDKIENRRTTFRTQTTVYQIPVVVHVIHKGEPVGSGSNISEAQILSQLQVLNEDFRRLNEDRFDTPAEFQSIAGSLDIEFILAKRTPEGLATDGIVRVKGSQSTWTLSDNFALKSQSYWPAEDYLNIWVADLAGLLIGYAQFPVSSLPGLENSPDNRLTDGLVIDYQNFGSIEDNDGSFSALDPNYNKGRTATHEMGHFFGLRHIWGDDEHEVNQCQGSNDYVSDTPNQGGPTNGCPDHPQSSCESADMFQNYLDYTYDQCMNLFTIGQVNRMTAVLENSPRRKSLWMSPGLQPPVPVPNDLGIRKIITPASTQCPGIVTPSIEVRNYGNNVVTSTRIALKINGSIVETKDFNFTPGIDTLDLTTLNFSDQILTAGSYTFEFEIIQTNGGTDGQPGDNTKSEVTLLPSSITVPFTETFTTIPLNWNITNFDNLHTWELKTAPDKNPGNKAMSINFYSYEDSPAEIDILTTAVFDLTNVETAYFTFDVAYAQFNGSEDALKVYVQTDCQASLIEGIQVYNKSGFALATAPSTTSPFVPKGEKEWRKEVVDISAFIGESHVQLAFAGINDFGNNLYIDNINFVTSAKEDLAITEIISPSPVTCNNEVIPILKVKNFGDTIRSYKVEYSLNGAGFQLAQTLENLTLLRGNEMELALPVINFQDGFNTVTFKLTEPNGLVDINQLDNERSIHLTVNKSSDRIPLREDFENEFSSRWSIVNPGGGMLWATVPTNFGQSLYINAFSNVTPGDEAWLVSPVLDLASANAASMFFDLSYAFRDSADDRLEVWASTDCGNTFDWHLLELSGNELSDQNSSILWKPNTEEDWERKYVPLNFLTGTTNARIAFIFTNANGNNLYIDNIEFFLSDDPEPGRVPSPYRIYHTLPSDPGDFYLTFNLEERQSVHYQVVDIMGRVLAETDINDVLNQTFLIDAGVVEKGIYIVRLQIGHDYFASKVFLGY